MVPSCSMILPGTIPETPISREWSRRLEGPPDHILYGGRLYGSFVNSAVTITATTLFTKLPAMHSPSWNDLRDPFLLAAPFTAYGSFRNCTRQNHGMTRNSEASSIVNSAVTALFTKLPASRLPAVP